MVPRSSATTRRSAAVAVCSLVALHGCSAAPSSAPAEPAPPVAAREPPRAPQVPDVDEDAGCVAGSAALTSGAVTWHRVGHGERLRLHGMDGAVVVSAGARTYVVAAGEELRDDPDRRRGLSRGPVIWAAGRWPDDAWLVTDEGTDTAIEGSNPPAKLFVWRWNGARWQRPDRRHISADLDEAPRDLIWRPGAVLWPSLDSGRITLERFGAGGAAPELLLPFASEGHSLARLVPLVGREELLGVGGGRSTLLQMARWCGTCSEPTVEALPIHLCGAGPINTLDVGIGFAARGDRVAFDIRTGSIGAAVPPNCTAGRAKGEPGDCRPGDNAKGGPGKYTPGHVFVGLVDGASVRFELVPPSGEDPVAALSLSPRGDLWLAHRQLLRRGTDGAWMTFDLPAGARVVESVVALDDDDIWITSVAGGGWDSPRALDRIGVQSGTFDLDSGKARP